MKKFAFFAALAGMLVASCSSDEPAVPSAEKLEKDASIDLTYSRSLSEGFSSATYKLSQWYLFDQNPLTKGKWVNKDLNGYLGFSFTVPSTIAIQNGKAYTTYNMFSSSIGPAPICYVWQALQYVNKDNKTLCIARHFEVVDDSDGYSVVIGDDTYELQGLTKDSFQLAYISNYFGGASGEGGLFKEITIHKAVAHEEISSNVLEYESEKELVKDIVEKARTQFGDILDLNELYKGKVEFDDPGQYVINLDDILKYYGVE